jgi:putative SOS response-associated peptidase YedK
MCNLYSVTKGQQAIREFTRAMRDRTGNLPPLPAIFPDMMAPVMRTADDGERELRMMRWGMPCPPQCGSRPIHATAMPAILTTPEEMDAWLAAPVEEALRLQRALPAGVLRVVARGEREDAGRQTAL